MEAFVILLLKDIPIYSMNVQPEANEKKALLKRSQVKVQDLHVFTLLVNSLHCNAID